MNIGPQTEAADRLHAQKYRQPGEGFREAMNRIADGLKDSEGHYQEFRDVLLDMRFLPGGRIQNAIGALRQTTAFNCFVSGKIRDSLLGAGSIMQRQVEAVATMKLGGGIGYGFSRLRPKGDPIRSLGSVTGGPIVFMGGFDAWCAVIASAGQRHGAQMGVLRVDHPDIGDFILAKQNRDKLTNFNISIAITDEFMEAVERKGTFQLKFNGRVYRTVDSVELWEKIMRSTYDWAEPGVIFIDRINEWNNLNYCETIEATNPCGEQPLPPYGACLLGSFNLTKYIHKRGNPLISHYDFDVEQYKADIPGVVRAMDNVIDRTCYPLVEQKVEATNKRRIGLGVAGLANAGESCGYAYGSPAFIEFEKTILTILRDESYRASANLAAEKGPFPLFDADRYLSGKFIATLPEEIRDLIAKHGIRNSHLTSIAPTGTISMCADNISGGIEPVFAHAVDRPITTDAGVHIERLEDYGSKFFGIRGRLADDVSATEHVNVLVQAQKYVDSACSKTINMDGKKMSWEAFQGIYKAAFNGGAKGCATFNKTGKRMGLLQEALSGSACTIDPNTGHKECS